ncbi:5-hydroxytryptamine receptor 3A-like [Oreochromis niloticus]|uniref:5-hydroxytryptamine receptor 3A-like n=1 Tax=Oreochromis niloticus TaxID=8128 RepID=UPI000DF42F43|nr:5-hydroxytryptamine receptor 3A-like [Oreochromis niloticus]
MCFDIISDNEDEVEKVCNFQDIDQHLNLSYDKSKYTMSRPIINNNNHTLVFLTVKLYAILDMREIDQTLITYIWVDLNWHNEFIEWNPDDFCGITYITIPTSLLWMPDITIEEMTEKDKASPSPYLSIGSNGWVRFRNDQVVLSTCKMHVYKFPFDTQSCNLSFRSIMHDDHDIRLQPSDNSTEATEWSPDLMRKQYEWLFINMTVTANNASDLVGQDIIIYTNTMKRRSVLYIANFILPVLFFLLLDLSSFLISDTGGEKLGFKVTILLAVTVMQLLLNEILPSSSDSIPLIAVYCIGIFALMLLSLLEAILVKHLIEKDSAVEDETDGDRSLGENSGNNQGSHNFYSCFREIKRRSHHASVDEVSSHETPSVSLSRKGSSSKLTEVSFALEKVSDELQETRKTVTLLSSNRKSGYWTRMAKKINKVFIIFYLTAVTVFLAIMVSLWNSAEDK